jgi:hypothetical protein
VPWCGLKLKRILQFHVFHAGSGDVSIYLCTTVQVFDFADTYRGSFTGACPFYCSASGYNVLFRSDSSE